jgi:hypothetical protein
MRMRMTPAVCIALISGAAWAIELPLGKTEVPACTSALAAGERRYRPPESAARTSQQALVKALVEGRGVQDPANAEGLQGCADMTAKQVDLRLLGAQPGQSNSLFKNIFMRCIEESELPVQVYFVALKVEDICNTDPRRGGEKKPLR